MIIIPQSKNTEAHLTPIRVKIQNRADLLALTLRILRYFFQQGLAGLQWTDDPGTTDIFIEDAFMENPEDDNMYPSIT